MQYLIESLIRWRSAGKLELSIWQSDSRQCIRKLSIKNIHPNKHPIKVHPKTYTLYMAVNKDFKNCKTDRLELDDLQNTNL